MIYGEFKVKNMAKKSQPERLGCTILYIRYSNYMNQSLKSVSNASNIVQVTLFWR